MESISALRKYGFDPDDLKTISKFKSIRNKFKINDESKENDCNSINCGECPLIGMGMMQDCMIHQIANEKANRRHIFWFKHYKRMRYKIVNDIIAYYKLKGIEYE